MNDRPSSLSSPAIELRDVVDADLDAFFEHQLDIEANRMAAFTSEDPADREAFDAHWTRIRGESTVILRTIVVNGAVAGHVAKFERDGDAEVTYWIGRPFWGRGIATGALRELLKEVTQRPIHARVVKDNAASVRVLQKCGFAVSGADRGFANARGAEVEELIFTLHDAATSAAP
jgi:RimJ/RimL family protein N-acetyltransferase